MQLINNNSLIELLLSIAIYSPIAATSFLVLTKYKLISYMQCHGRYGLNKVFNCHLCICFWLCFVISIIGIIFGAGLITLIAPFAGASITRAIIN